MNIEFTEYESIHHATQKFYSSSHGDHIFHSLEVFGKMIIDGKEFDVCYQTGHSFECGDYAMPSNRLEIYYDGSHELINILWEWHEEDFENTEFIQEQVEEANKLCDSIKTKEDLLQLYKAFNDQTPISWHYLDNHTDDADDYIFIDEEESNECELKDQSSS